MSAPALTPSRIEARDLYRFFRVDDEETLALKGVSVQVNAGETVAVVGPSGSGKSTLLACLAGLDEPAGGAVFVDGHRISHRPEAERARLRGQRIGVVRQTRNLLSHLSLRDNVRLAQRIGRARDAGRQPAPHAALLDEVGLLHRADALPRQLSGGELVRGALAVALANAPAVILADEPTGELDGVTEQRVLELLRHRADDGTGVLIVTHSATVTRAADRVITLIDGRIKP